MPRQTVKPDGELLDLLLRLLGLSVRKAARLAGHDHTMLSKVVRGTRDTLSADLYQRLMTEVLPNTLRERIEEHEGFIYEACLKRPGGYDEREDTPHTEHADRHPAQRSGPRIDGHGSQ